MLRTKQPELYIFFDHRFVRNSLGQAASRQNYHAEHLSARYGAVFDNITLVTRISEVRVPEARRADSERIDICAVAGWASIPALLRTIVSVVEHCTKIRRNNSAVILIAPGLLGILASLFLVATRYPFAIEVVGDPYESLIHSGNSRRFKSIAARSMGSLLRFQARRAAQSAYVTKRALQVSYPPSADSFTTNYSSIDLRPEAFAASPRQLRPGPPHFVGVVAFMDAPYKGIDDLIQAGARLQAAGKDIRLRIAGGGRLREQYEADARSLGLCSDVCEFVGFVTPGRDLFSFYDDLDLVVSASLTEGLPRSVIEASARGIPVVGTDVGGTAEIVGPEELVKPRSPDALAQAIEELLGDAERYASVSRRNIEIARAYQAEILDARKHDFYRRLADLTADANVT